MEQIIWRPVAGYEDRYEVSNDGKVRSHDMVVKCRVGTRVYKGRTINQRQNNRGYTTVNLYRDREQKTMLVHRLVAIAFIPNPENKAQVNHIDGDITNNTVDNLEWLSDDENKYHSASVFGGTQRPKRRVCATDIFTNETIIFDGLRDAERHLGIDHKSALNVVQGKQRHTKGYTLSYREGGDA